jgi:hypothetical protein
VLASQAADSCSVFLHRFKFKLQAPCAGCRRAAWCVQSAGGWHQTASLLSRSLMVHAHSLPCCAGLARHCCLAPWSAGRAWAGGGAAILCTSGRRATGAAQEVSAHQRSRQHDDIASRAECSMRPRQQHHSERVCAMHVGRWCAASRRDVRTAGGTRLETTEFLCWLSVSGWPLVSSGRVSTLCATMSSTGSPQCLTGMHLNPCPNWSHRGMMQTTGEGLILDQPGTRAVHRTLCWLLRVCQQSLQPAVMMEHASASLLFGSVRVDR